MSATPDEPTRPDEQHKDSSEQRGAGRWLRKSLSDLKQVGADIKQTALDSSVDLRLNRDPEARARLEERRQAAAAESNRRAEQRRAEEEINEAKAPYTQAWRARFVDSTVPVPGVKKEGMPSPSAPMWAESLSRSAERGVLTTDMSGLTFAESGKPNAVISIPWESVVDIRVDDASTHKTSTRIAHSQQPLSFRTTPVAVSRQKTFQEVLLTVETSDGAFHDITHHF